MSDTSTHAPRRATTRAFWPYSAWVTSRPTSQRRCSVSIAASHGPSRTGFASDGASSGRVWAGAIQRVATETSMSASCAPPAGGAPASPVEVTPPTSGDAPPVAGDAPPAAGATPAVAHTPASSDAPAATPTTVRRSRPRMTRDLHRKSSARPQIIPDAACERCSKSCRCSLVHATRQPGHATCAWDRIDLRVEPDLDHRMLRRS